jgi:hypothetical protein
MANLIRLKQIEGSTQLEAAVSAGNAISASGGSFQQAISTAVSASIQTSLSSSITDIVSASLSGALSIIATDVEVSAVSASIAATNLTISSSNYNLSSSVSASLSLISSSLNAFTSSIGLTIKQKLNTENVITSSRQLDGQVINNLTLGTTGDAYSLIVSGALAVVDADITISGSQYNVGGQIWVNGQTGSAGNPPSEPYNNVGNTQADIIDQGEW